MYLLPYVLLAIAIFLIGRKALFKNRLPIPETSGKVYKVTDAAELDAILSSTTYVVVDFYADWCSPCRAMAPIFSELADNHSLNGRLAFVKVNVDHANIVTRRYSVSTVPTFIFFHDCVPKGVAVKGLRSRPAVHFTSDGLVDRIQGADRAALEAIVQALAMQAEGGPVLLGQVAA
ncbi:hypothetical protein DL769_005603 [Monosporascus sp. CRB-8-3]|nr:hypothetical protein DL769_005603 [Monosporascus sp. CRB-8-3]